MRRFLRRPFAFLAAALVLPACQPPEPPAETPPSAETPTAPPSPEPSDSAPTPSPDAEHAVNLEAGTVGDVDFDVPGETLLARYPGRVQVKQSPADGGDPVTVYVVQVGDAVVRKQGRLVFYTSPSYRTADGLGPGATVEAFRAVYGPTDIGPGEGAQCQGAGFTAGGRVVRACTEHGCLAASCRVTEVQFVAEAPPPTAVAEPSVRDAVETVQRYYAALDARRYRDAYRLWGDNGRASGQTFEVFAAGFAETRSTAVTVGTPGEVEGAAGSRYVELPVVVTATTAAGARQRFAGAYTLRRSVVDGSTAAQRAWSIASASLRARS